MPATTVKSRPLILHAWEVRAILAGQKTQLRRLVDPQPGVPVTDAIPVRDFPHGPPTREWYWRPAFGHLNRMPSGGWDFSCPYGKPGDRLVVKEAAYIAPPNFAEPRDGNVTDTEGRRRIVGYAASMDGEAVRCAKDYGVGLTPASRMPKWASRLDLEITTEIRVERLGSISEADAIAEGCPGTRHLLEVGGWLDPPSFEFRRLWESMYGPGSWDPERWVWVVGVKRTEGE